MNNSIDNSDGGRAFVFYPSFDRSLRHLPPDVRLEVYDAMSRYGCYGEIAEDMSPMAMAIFELVRPTVDASITRYESSGRGGAPKGSRNNPSGRRGKLTAVAANDTELTETNSGTNQELTETNSGTNQELTETNSGTNLEKRTNKIKDKRIKIKDKRIDNCSRNYARAREEFLEDFFIESRQPAIARQAETLGITGDEYRKLVEQVLDDWELNGPVPAPDNELRSRMLCTVRKKFYAQEQAERRRASTAGGKAAATIKHDQSYYDRLEAGRLRREAIHKTETPLPEAIADKIAKFYKDIGSPADPEAQAIADARNLANNPKLN